MKKTGSLLLAVLFVCASAGVLRAETFVVSATIPAATSVNMTATSVPAAGGTGTTITNGALTFGTMYFDNVVPAGQTTAPNIWRAPNYFTIDIANAGAGAPTVTLSYAEGSKPVSQVNGLGWKATADFKKVTGSGTNTTDNVITGHTKKALKDVTNEQILPADTLGGWLRVYIGLSDGAAGAPGEAFTNADMPGTYTGTLTITATPS